MNRKSYWMVGTLGLALAGGCPPEDDAQVSVDAGDDGAGSQTGGESGANGSGGESGANGGGNSDEEPGTGTDAACAAVSCPTGTRCQVTEVDCVNDPCDPLVECVAGAGAGCELIDCQPGHRCVEDAKGVGACVPADEDAECTLECADGKHCENVEVTCVKAPCNPVPECVDDDACTDFECDPGKRCELIYPPCAPPQDDMPNPNCQPQPTCVTDNACGPNTCQGGQVCCNASCGICTNPGMSCIQIAC